MVDRRQRVDSAAGYDTVVRRRYVYAFLSADGRRIKIGMVGRQERLAVRLREVVKRGGHEGLAMVAHVSFETTEHECEDIEAAVRLWLSRNGVAVHAHSVDWLELIEPGSEHDWQNQLEWAKSAIDARGEPR